MNTINRKQRSKSTLKFCKLYSWDYNFEREAAYYPEKMKRYVKVLSSKCIKSLEVPICRTIAMPLGMALATWACALPNIKRIYICDDKCHAKYMAECSKKANVPLITKDPRSLIPYDVLRELGKGKVIFVYPSDMTKFTSFQIDDLRKLNLRASALAYATKHRKLHPEDKRFHYKAEWLSDDEVVLH